MRRPMKKKGELSPPPPPPGASYQALGIQMTSWLTFFFFLSSSLHCGWLFYAKRAHQTFERLSLMRGSSGCWRLDLDPIDRLLFHAALHADCQEEFESLGRWPVRSTNNSSQCLCTNFQIMFSINKKKASLAQCSSGNCDRNGNPINK